MDLNHFFQYLTDPQQLDATTLKECREIVEYYPYFQVGQVLYTKNLKNCNHFRYRDQLKLTALFSSDRALLQKIMEDRFPEENVTKKKEDEKFTSSGPYQLEGDSNDIPDIGTLANQLKSQRNKNFQRKSKQNELIDKFVLKDKVEIKLPCTEETKAKKQEEGDQSGEFMTETLASIYVKQGLYDEAIRAFERLILKYPEKNAYFAFKIKEIEKLLKK